MTPDWIPLIAALKRYEVGLGFRGLIASASLKRGTSGRGLGLDGVIPRLDCLGLIEARAPADG